jgi:hypothetical protein
MKFSAEDQKLRPNGSRGFASACLCSFRTVAFAAALSADREGTASSSRHCIVRPQRLLARSRSDADELPTKLRFAWRGARVSPLWIVKH